MLLIILLLNGTAPVRLVDGRPHGIRDLIRIHHDVTLGISRGTSNGLNQRGPAPKEALLVRIQNRYQRNLRNVQALPQKVDPDQYVEHVQSHVPNDLRTLQRVNIGMQVLHANADLLQIVRKILRHALCQCRHENLVVLCHFPIDLAHQIINLPLHGTHNDLGVQQSRRSDDLFGSKKLMLLFILRRSRGYKQHLINVILKFLKA